MAAFNYLNNYTFDGLEYDTPEEIVYTGRVFTIAWSNGWEALEKYITDRGGTVKMSAAKSADYVIIGPIPKPGKGLIYKHPMDVYKKALEYRRSTGKPSILRDVDFYIIADMFSKLKIDEKRRMVMEYVNGNPLYREKNSKKVIDFIAGKARSDAYLGPKGIAKALTSAGNASTRLLLPDADECASFTLKDWRRYFSFSANKFDKEDSLAITKCKAQNSTIRIPDTVAGKKIKQIGRHAFDNMDNSVEEVIVPSTVNGIEAYAFMRCKGLKRVVLENPKCYASQDAFRYCPNLKEVIRNGENVIDQRYSDPDRILTKFPFND